MGLVFGGKWNEVLRDEIKMICRERGIETLVHFTDIQNLQSILKHGLLGRTELQCKRINFKYNDVYRLDGHLNAVCLSISFPNYQMFYKYSKNNTEDWVVLGISSKVLWEKRCKFYVDNAASNNSRNSESKGDRSLPSALREMFQDYETIKRSTLPIPPNYTTNPQAEVLVFDKIPVEDIISVDFFSQSAKNKWLNQTTIKVPSTISINCSNRYFKPRQDYQYWKKDNNTDIIKNIQNFLFSLINIK